MRGPGRRGASVGQSYHLDYRARKGSGIIFVREEGAGRKSSEWAGGRPLGAQVTWPRTGSGGCERASKKRSKVAEAPRSPRISQVYDGVKWGEATDPPASPFG